MLTRKFGTHDPGEWLAEGLGLYVSARALRAQWAHDRRNFRSSQRKNPGHRPPSLFLIRLSGMPRASMLLLAYAAEMNLKCGLIKCFTHCRPGLIDREVRAYGHDLARIATEISFEMDHESRAQIDLLAHLLMDSRYPLEPPTDDGWEGQVQYIRNVNARMGRTWNKNIFADLCRLVQRMRRHVELIDGDEKNPSSVRHISLSQNGYMTLRYGGNLAPRVTYRDEDDRRSPRTITEIEQLAISSGWIEAKHYWPRFLIILDGKKKTSVLRRGVD